MVDRLKIKGVVYQRACATEDDFLNKLIDAAIDATLEEHNHLSHQVGRHKKELDVESIVALRNSTNPPMSYTKIAEKMGCAVGTVINRLKEQGAYAPIFKKLPQDGPEVHP